MVKKLFLIVCISILLVLVGAPHTDATGTACAGVVVQTPIGLGLPVMTTPSFFQGQSTGYNLVSGQLVQVYQTMYNPMVGDIWYRIDGGWAQAYSGYTTGFSQILLADFPCAQQLPHSIGD